jgi:hypothetical protein
VDGSYGGGTEAGMKQFQLRHGLAVDGIAGEQSWHKLFNEEIPPTPLTAQPLAWRCLALTGTFETGAPFPDCFAGLSGDFDGQGLSFGVLQWNIGQGTLQPLLQRMITSHPETARDIFHISFDRIATMLAAPKKEQLAFVRAIQDPNRKTIHEPWRGMFKALGRTTEFQQIEADAAATLYQEARQLCREYGLWSERGVALMFDIKTQNGSIPNRVREAIAADFQGVSPELPPAEQETARLRIVANRRAEAARARFVEDVRARKLCIASGRGVVHGIGYDLEGQFGIGLRRV